MIGRLIAIVCGSGLILATSGLVFAADMAVKAPPPPPPAVWDWSGLYIGVGGSYNWTHFDQSLQGVSGLISVFNGPVLTAQGQEGGAPFSTSTETKPVSPRTFSSVICIRLRAATGWPGSNSTTNTQTSTRSRT